MRNYRAYVLGVDGHRFVWAKDFLTDHPDDAAALNAAKRLSDKHEVEVWEDGRLVARLSPSEEGTSPMLAPSWPFDREGKSVRLVESISPSNVSELASVASESNPILPGVDEVTK
jgi:hypothetical protein